ncbi:hypothetical protein QTP70_032734, partial [Hemibagrus guttatus]
LDTGKMAADTQVSDTLKKFAVKVTTSSVKERKEILEELKECINGKNLPEPAIKGLCKLFYLTLHRYRDAASRRAVLSVIDLLAKAQPDAIASHLPSGLLTCGVVSKGIMPGRSTASASCCALPWIYLIVRVVFPMLENRGAPHWKKMVEVQSLLLAEAMGGAPKNAIKSVTKQLNKLWKDIPGLVDQYMSTLLSLDQSPSSLPMLAACVDFCTSQKDMATINKHKAAILDLYLKTVLMSKTRPLQHIMAKSGSLLHHVSHAEFKEQLLPALQKALLRSPENSMQTISSMLASLTLDLSQYALDIGKGLASQLKASNVELMEHAVQAMQNLAKQCSDPAAIQDLVTHLFSILGGSEGKLTVVAQKMNVLSGIKSCSCHAVSGSSNQSLSSSVVLQFIPFLQQEVHEGTLVHAVSVMSQWMARLNVDVPAALRDWLKKAFTLKSSTSAVRHAYLQAMLRAFKGDTLSQAVDFVPFLIQTVEKAAAQNSQQALSEAVAASLLLCHLSMLDSIPESKLTPLWNLILDEKKPLFTTEKFLGQTSEEALCTVLQLCERLFLDHPHRLNNIKAHSNEDLSTICTYNYAVSSSSVMYHRAIVAVLLCRVYQVRKRAHQCVKKLFSSLGGSNLAHGLLRELCVVINKHKVLPPEALQTEAGEWTEVGRLYIPPWILLEALRALCAAAGQWNDSSEAQKLALVIILVAHHPSIVAAKSELWPLLLSSMNIDASMFIDQHLQTILPLLLEGNADNQAVRNAIGELSNLSPGKLLPCVMDHVIQRLSNPALKQVTHQEYAIMKTPEGELYDKSIIMSAQQESSKKGNIKRENKAYSFKEQIIELELKEEIKKKKGIKDEVQLTSKQREMMQNQLEKEYSVRKKLQELDMELQCTVGLLEAIMARHPPQISHHIPRVLQVLLPLLHSPLAAPHVHQTFLHIGTCVLQNQLHILALLVGHVTLRLLKPECELDPAWSQEDLNTATRRTIQLLHTQTVPHRESKTDVRPLSAPAFSFCFPLLQAILSINSGISEETELMLTHALQIIHTHSQLRSSSDATDVLIDENGPELLPRMNMLLLLTKVIGTSTPRLQVLASSCLTALCVSAGGQEGCALAEQAEIDVLLEALLSPCFSVRDATLRGLLELKLTLPTDSAEPNGLNVLRRLWVAKFDVEEEGRALANKLWQTLCLELVPELCPLLISDVTYHEETVRVAAAEALSCAVSQYQEESAVVLSQLTELYQQKLYRPPPVLDALGRVISEAPPDQWAARCGIALALNKLSQWLRECQVTPIFQFFVPDALNDRHSEVRRCMLDAALSVLNTHGKDNVNSLLPVFEEFLKNAPQDASYDSVRQSVVILMGSLAKHLDKSDHKVKPIVAKLITALSTPSQQVNAVPFVQLQA